MSNPEEQPDAPAESPTETEAGGRTLDPNTTVPRDGTESGTTVPQDDA